jgi:hypothetical protein
VASVFFHDYTHPGRGSILGVVFGARFFFLDSFQARTAFLDRRRGGSRPLPIVNLFLNKRGYRIRHRFGIITAREIPPHVFRLGGGRRLPSFPALRLFMNFVKVWNSPKFARGFGKWHHAHDRPGGDTGCGATRGGTAPYGATVEGVSVTQIDAA